MKYALIMAGILILLDLVRKLMINKEQIRESLYRTEETKLIKMISPKKDTETYNRQKKLIQKARLNISVERYQMVMLSTFFITLIITSTIFITQHKIKTDGVFSKKSININIINFETTVGNDDVFLNKLTKKAYETIKFKELLKGSEYENLQRRVYTLVSEQGIDEALTLEYAEKVYENLLYLYKNSFDFRYIIFIVLLSLGSILTPNIFLRIRGKRTEDLMETELNKLEILTLLLLKKEDVNIYQILLKLHSKSDVFRPYFKKCINDFQKDGRKAMEVMQQEAEYKPFTDFVNILKQGIDANKRITFNTLEITRRLRNEILVSITNDKIEKKNRNILLVRFPMLIAGIYLLILPWIMIFRENI